MDILLRESENRATETSARYYLADPTTETGPKGVVRVLPAKYFDSVGVLSMLLVCLLPRVDRPHFHVPQDPMSNIMHNASTLAWPVQMCAPKHGNG